MGCHALMLYQAWARPTHGAKASGLTMVLLVAPVTHGPGAHNLGVQPGPQILVLTAGTYRGSTMCCRLCFDFTSGYFWRASYSFALLGQTEAMQDALFAWNDKLVSALVIVLFRAVSGPVLSCSCTLCPLVNPGWTVSS